MKLISMTDFVLSDQVKSTLEYSDAYKLIRNYAKFLKQPLTLGMFVPVDKHGVILEDLKYCCDGKHCGCMGMPVNVCSHKQIDEYYIAKERVLFEGFELHNGKNVINKDLGIVIVFSGIISILIEGNNGLGGFSKNDATIEDLVILDLTLTETAIKQIGI